MLPLHSCLMILIIREKNNFIYSPKKDIINKIMYWINEMLSHSNHSECIGIIAQAEKKIKGGTRFWNR